MRRLAFALAVGAGLIGGQAEAAVRPARCDAGAIGARCGTISVPLDRTRPGGPQISVYFEQHRPRRRRPTGTIVAIEGGPGYPTSGSRDSYLGLFRPLLGTRQLILVDLRGTGRSGALACHAFDDGVDRYIARAARCARQLGARRDSYATGESAEDIEGVLRAVGAGRIDLYGDSYGTYAAQAFAYRHPERLRSLVLDASYPLPGTDPALADLASGSRRALRLACARRPACAAKGVDPVAALARLVARVRRKPLVLSGPDGDGVERVIRLDEPALVATVLSGAYTTIVDRDLPAALASLDRGDSRPLARVVAEAQGDLSDPAVPRDYSEALYLAVTCHDYPQMWDLAAPLTLRRAQLRRLRRERPAGAFAPFSAAAWTGIDYEGADACLRWPAPRHPDPVVPVGAVPPAVPTLVLGGDLDTVTPIAEGRVVARRFHRSRLVVVSNSVHVTAVGDNDRCASQLVRRFVRRLAAGAASCASAIAEVRVVDRFPRSLAEVEPAASQVGDRSTVWARRVAAAAALTVSDAVARWQLNYSGTISGLRAGHAIFVGGRRVRFNLVGTSFVPGVIVDGHATWDRDRGFVRGRVTVAGSRVAIAFGWSTRGPLRRAWMSGGSSTGPLRATMLAP